MGNFDDAVIYPQKWYTLFEYEQNSSETSIRISTIQSLVKCRVNYKEHKGVMSSREVYFKLCGLDLSESFAALSMTLSLVKVFEQRQFGTGDKKLAMRFPDSGYGNLQLFCALEPYQKSYEGLCIGWIRDNNVQRAHSMHIGYVHHLRNALHKAMGWLSPPPQVEVKTLEDIRR